MVSSVISRSRLYILLPRTSATLLGCPSSSLSFVPVKLLLLLLIAAAVRLPLASFPFLAFALALALSTFMRSSSDNAFYAAEL
jgi:hypothetical protein